MADLKGKCTLVTGSTAGLGLAIATALAASGCNLALNNIAPPDEGNAVASALAQEFGVDEVMVSPAASARRGTDPATAPARDKTLELLAKELF